MPKAAEFNLSGAAAGMDLESGGGIGSATFPG